VDNFRAAVALLVALPCLAACQTAILQIRVLEGDGAVHAAGSHNVRPLTVEVTDETGKPLAHAAVSFHLPDDGPSGIFLNGLHTEVAITDAIGRASIRGLQWNRIPGSFQIRIVASFEQARAGLVSQQYIDGPAGSPGRTLLPAARGGHTKWLVIAALAAGGAAAGILVGRAGGGNAATSPAATVPVTVGTPVITVVKP
jgi:hypothetical protein